MKNTTELLKELEKFESFEDYEKTNGNYIIRKTLSEYLNDIIKEKNLTKSQVIKKAELNENYAYQLFSGLKSAPTRDKLICLGIGMELSLTEINSLLKLAGLSPLYPKIKRDSIIIINYKNGKTVVEINEDLYNHNEKTLN